MDPIHDPTFEERTYIQVKDSGILEALRRLRSTVIELLSTTDKEAVYVGKEQ